MVEIGDAVIELTRIELTLVTVPLLLLTHVSAVSRSLHSARVRMLVHGVTVQHALGPK